MMNSRHFEELKKFAPDTYQIRKDLEQLTKEQLLELASLDLLRLDSDAKARLKIAIQFVKNMFPAHSEKTDVPCDAESQLKQKVQESLQKWIVRDPETNQFFVFSNDEYDGWFSDADEAFIYKDPNHVIESVSKLTGLAREAQDLNDWRTSYEIFYELFARGLRVADTDDFCSPERLPEILDHFDLLRGAFNYSLRTTLEMMFEDESLTARDAAVLVADLTFDPDMIFYFLEIAELKSADLQAFAETYFELISKRISELIRSADAQTIFNFTRSLVEQIPDQEIRQSFVWNNTETMPALLSWFYGAYLREEPLDERLAYLEKSLPFAQKDPYGFPGVELAVLEFLKSALKEKGDDSRYADFAAQSFAVSPQIEALYDLISLDPDQNYLQVLEAAADKMPKTHFNILAASEGNAGPLLKDFAEEPVSELIAAASLLTLLARGNLEGCLNKAVLDLIFAGRMTEPITESRTDFYGTGSRARSFGFSHEKASELIRRSAVQADWDSIPVSDLLMQAKARIFQYALDVTTKQDRHLYPSAALLIALLCKACEEQGMDAEREECIQIFAPLLNRYHKLSSLAAIYGLQL